MSETIRRRMNAKKGERSACGLPRVIDLSVPLVSLGSPVYPGSPLPVRTTFMTIAESGFQSNVWMFEEHTGTHVDAPAHILPAGRTLERIPLSRYIGRGVVLDFSTVAPKSEIGERAVARGLRDEGVNAKEPHPELILLFHTGHTRKFGTPGWMDNPVLNEGACNFIARLKVKAIGIDAASPDREPYPAHRILLPSGIAIYENLANLHRLLHKKFTFVGAPLSLVGGTASPVRALALIG